MLESASLKKGLPAVLGFDVRALPFAGMRRPGIGENALVKEHDTSESMQASRPEGLEPSGTERATSALRGMSMSMSWFYPADEITGT